MISYTLGNGGTYSFDYQELKRDYHRIVHQTDEQFMADLPAALHFAVFVCWVKGLNAHWVLADDGIIHQLAHLIHLPDEPVIMDDLPEIRRLFAEQLELK